MTEYLDRASLQSIDGLPISDTSIDMIDLQRVEAHISNAARRGRYQGPMNVNDYLREKRCIVVDEKGTFATPAGILCFGRQPQEVFPRAVVDLVHYTGTDIVSFEVAHLEKNIGGTVFEQVERVESYLWSNTRHGMTLSNEGARRIEIHEYPRGVIRELVVNMLAHRDYANTLTTSRVMLFRDRIEWLNPGGLPPGLSIETIPGRHVARNPILISILYEAGYVEAIGQGLATVITVLAREQMERPHFQDTGSFFQVMVVGKPPENFYDGSAHTRLTDRQRRILSFIRIEQEVTPTRVAALLENTVTTRSLQRDIKVLEEAGLIVKTGSGRGRNVRYRIS